MKNILKNLKNYPLVIYFAVVLYVISIADLFSPVKERSELENRGSVAVKKHCCSLPVIQTSAVAVRRVGLRCMKP